MSSKPLARRPDAFSLDPYDLSDNDLINRSNNIFNCVPNTKPDICPFCELSLTLTFFFDGTKNHLGEDFLKGRASNPAKLFLLTNGCSTKQAGIEGQFKERVEYRDKGEYAFYYSGVGKNLNKDLSLKQDHRHDVDEKAPSEFFGAAAGTTVRLRIDEAFKQIDDILQNPRYKKVETVYISAFGFSRGAATARLFINELVYGRCKDKTSCEIRPDTHTRKDELFYKGKKLVVRFLGLFDTVSSIGWLKNDNDLGYQFDIPPQVKKCTHMVSMHEYRHKFPVESIRTAPSYEPNNYEEIVYPGVHCDVGGSYGPVRCDIQESLEDQQDHQHVSNLLASIPLMHMYKSAYLSGVPMASFDDVMNTPSYQALLNLDEPKRREMEELKREFNSFIKEFPERAPLEAYFKQSKASFLTWLSYFTNRQPRDLDGDLTNGVKGRWQQRFYEKIHSEDNKRKYMSQMLVGPGDIAEERIEREWKMKEREKDFCFAYLHKEYNAIEAIKGNEQMADYVKHYQEQENRFIPDMFSPASSCRPDWTTRILYSRYVHDSIGGFTFKWYDDYFIDRRLLENGKLVFPIYHSDSQDQSQAA